MKKTYIIPRIEEDKMDSFELLAASGGIDDGVGKPGHEYDSEDPSYGRSDEWNEEW